MPYDLHPIIWGYVFEAERAARYRARELRFLFHGFIALADREAMLQMLNDIVAWRRLTLDAGNTCIDTPPFVRSRRAAQTLRRLQTWLNAWFHALFEPDTEDLVNLAGHAWTQIVFQITSLEPEDNDHDYVSHRGVRLAQILAASADGLHRIRLQFTRLPVGGSYTSVRVQYVGPQRFRTFDNRNHSQARGGTLEDLTPPRASPPFPLNDEGVFEGWRRV